MFNYAYYWLGRLCLSLMVLRVELWSSFLLVLVSNNVKCAICPEVIVWSLTGLNPPPPTPYPQKKAGDFIYIDTL